MPAKWKKIMWHTVIIFFAARSILEVWMLLSSSLGAIQVFDVFVFLPLILLLCLFGLSNLVFGFGVYFSGIYSGTENEIVIIMHVLSCIGETLSLYLWFWIAYVLYLTWNRVIALSALIFFVIRYSFGFVYQFIAPDGSYFMKCLFQTIVFFLIVCTCYGLFMLRKHFQQSSTLYNTVHNKLCTTLRRYQKIIICALIILIVLIIYSCFMVIWMY